MSMTSAKLVPSPPSSAGIIVPKRFCFFSSAKASDGNRGVESTDDANCPATSEHALALAMSVEGCSETVLLTVSDKDAFITIP